MEFMHKLFEQAGVIVKQCFSATGVFVNGKVAMAEIAQVPSIEEMQL